MQGNEANSTIFNNWKEFVDSECRTIVESNLEAKQYDQLKSREYANAICEQVRMPNPDHRQTLLHQPQLQVHR